MAFHHFRNKDGHEVDLVIEGGAHTLAGVEVKASSTVGQADFRTLKMLRDSSGGRFRNGIVLYDGEKVLRFEDSLFAVPIAAQWEDWAN